MSELITLPRAFAFTHRPPGTRSCGDVNNLSARRACKTIYDFQVTSYQATSEQKGTVELEVASEPWASLVTLCPTCQVPAFNTIRIGVRCGRALSQLPCFLGVPSLLLTLRLAVVNSATSDPGSYQAGS